MKKKIKKINEFLDTPFELDAETEIKVLTDEEIFRRTEESMNKQKDFFSKNKKDHRDPPSKEKFEIMVRLLLKSPECSEKDVDELSIKFYGEPYYKK